MRGVGVGILSLGLIMMFGFWCEVRWRMGIFQGHGVKRNVRILDYGCRMVIDGSLKHRRVWISR
jgi:hypothetical protein